MTKPLITCGECGRTQPHVARGLCGACYRRLRKTGAPLPATTRPIGAQCKVATCTEPAHAQWLCRVHYMRQWRYGDAEVVTVKVANREAAERLLARCLTPEANEQGPCWPWPGAIRPNGYGHKRRSENSSLAHRVVWESVFGAIAPPTLKVLHGCDNPPCVRPSHLFLGTVADNTADMLSKGREYRAYGDDHHNITLSDADVAMIRTLREEGLLYRQIAERFGVDQSYVGKIVRGQARSTSARLTSEREVDRIHAGGLSGAA